MGPSLFLVRQLCSPNVLEPFLNPRGLAPHIAGRLEMCICHENISGWSVYSCNLVRKACLWLSFIRYRPRRLNLRGGPFLYLAFSKAGFQTNHLLIDLSPESLLGDLQVEYRSHYLLGMHDAIPSQVPFMFRKNLELPYQNVQLQRPVLLKYGPC